LGNSGANPTLCLSGFIFVDQMERVFAICREWLLENGGDSGHAKLLNVIESYGLQMTTPLFPTVW
jgi:hypothetical protein